MSYFDRYDTFGERVTLFAPIKTLPAVSDGEELERFHSTALKVIDQDYAFEQRMEASGAEPGPPAEWFLRPRTYQMIEQEHARAQKLARERAKVRA